MTRILLGVGNRLSRDDGVGPTVAKRLEGTQGWHAIDCGTALENVSGIVSRERPDLLVIVDAAQMGLPAGSIRTLPIEAKDRMLASTHGLPLGFVLERLGSAVEAVLLIGIQPEDLAFGEGLSTPVAAAVDELLDLLTNKRVDQVEPLKPLEAS